MRTDVITVPATEPPAPQLSGVWGFVASVARSGALAPAFPVTARVRYEDGALAELAVHEGVTYASGRKMAEVRLFSTVAGWVDVTSLQTDEDATLGAVPAACFENTLAAYPAGDGFNVQKVIEIRPPPWARYGVLWVYQHAAALTGPLTAQLDSYAPGGTDLLRSHNNNTITIAAASGGANLWNLGMETVPAAASSPTVSVNIPGPLAKRMQFRLGVNAVAVGPLGTLYVVERWGR